MSGCLCSSGREAPHRLCPVHVLAAACDRSLGCAASEHRYGCQKARKDEHDRNVLQSVFIKLRRGGTTVELYHHEAEALYDEFCRLANFATLLGEPSPAEMAGLVGR